MHNTTKSEMALLGIILMNNRLGIAPYYSWIEVVRIWML